nr:retrovirus-related Pol polyprotein from transposon TNT 1-94 [Tanacetum cinerariifolium]
MILESVEHGPLIWPTVEENGVIKTKKYAELSAAEKIQADCDIKAINVILHGLPTDIYSLVNHHKVAKDLLERVQLLMQDPLAFVANQQMPPPHFNTYRSSYNNPQLQQQFSPSQHGSIQPNQHYSSHYPSQTQFNHSSILPSHTFQSQMNHQTSIVPQAIPHVTYQSPQAPTQLMTGSPFVDSGFAVLVFSPGDDLIAYLNKGIVFLIAVASRQCTQPKRPKNATWFKEKAMLAQAQEARKILDEEQLAFLTDPRIPADQAQTIIPHNVAFQTEDLDTYDSDCNNLSTTQVVLLANISNYGSDVISEENANKDQNNESITAELERYKERVKTFEQRLNIDLSRREKIIDSQMDDMIREKLALKEQVDSLEQNLSKQIKEKESLFKTFTVFKNKSKEKENKYMKNEIDLEKKIKELDNIICKVGQSAQTVHMLIKPQAFYDNTHKQALGYQNSFYLKKVQRIKPTLYDGVVLSNTHVAMHVIDDEETLILEEDSQSKMSEKAKDPEVIAKKISHKPIDYAKLNSLTDDFGKHFSLQQELLAEQAFWFHILNPTIEPSYTPPVIVDVPSELPKVGLVNASLKRLKFHLTQFDSGVKKRTTPNALEEEYFEKNDLKAQLQDKDTAICKLKDTIKSLRKNNKEEIVDHDRCDLATINEDSKITRVLQKEQSDSLINKPNLKSAENEDLKAQIQDKVFVITSLKNDLCKLKGKTTVDNAAQIPFATTVAPGMFKLDLEPLAPKLVHNREILINYLKHTQEQVDILRAIVEQAKAKQPLDNALDFALKCSTSASGSKPSDNTKNNRISQPSSSNKINKVQDQPRSIKTRKNKKNCVNKVKCNDHVMQSMSNANSVSVPIKNAPVKDYVNDITSGCLYAICGTVRFENNQITRITGYGENQLGNVIISRLAKDDLARGIPRLKFQKDHLCSACALGKSKKSSHQPKAEDTNQEKIYLLHMYLCGLMRAASIKGKMYILVIVDDYSRFTWVRFLKTKDEAPTAIIKCIKNIQVRLNAPVRNVQTDNGTEFVNQTLREFYENGGISHKTSVARTP